MKDKEKVGDNRKKVKIGGYREGWIYYGECEDWRIQRRIEILRRR